MTGFQAPRIAAALMAFSVLTVRAAVPQEPIAVSGARPLHQVIKTLETRYGIVITFEDGPFSNPIEYVDVTQRQKPDSPKPILSPAHERFVFTPPVQPASDAASVRKLVDQLVADFNRDQTRIEYLVDSSQGVFHVFPKRVLNKAGDLVPYRSLLDVTISVLTGTRSGSETIATILDAAGAASGRRLLDVTLPSPLMNLQLTTGFEKVKARDAIMAVLAKTSRPFSWQILCQPGDGEACYFSTTPPGVW